MIPLPLITRQLSSTQVARANGGRLDKPTGYLGMAQVLARSEGEARRQSKAKRAHKAGPPSRNAINPDRQCPWSCRRCVAGALRCVVLRGDTASQPVSIHGAPLGRIGTAGAQHCAGSFRYLTPKKGKAGYPVSNKPFGFLGEGGDAET